MWSACRHAKQHLSQKTNATQSYFLNVGLVYSFCSDCVDFKVNYGFIDPLSDVNLFFLVIKTEYLTEGSGRSVALELKVWSV